MGFTTLRKDLILGGLVAVICALTIISGCMSNSKSPTTTDKNPAATQPASGAVATKGGAQLWAENCARCHNLRSPSSFSDEQWDVAVQHMRMRVPLTGQEQRAIVEFLKSAN